MIDVAFGNGSSGVLVDPVINNTVAIEDDATWLLRHCEELLSMNPIPRRRVLSMYLMMWQDSLIRNERTC